MPGRAVPPEQSTLEGLLCSMCGLLSWAGVLGGVLHFLHTRHQDVSPVQFLLVVTTAGDNKHSATCLCAFGCPNSFSCLAQLWRARGSDLCVSSQLAVRRFANVHWPSAAAKRRWGLPRWQSKGAAQGLALKHSGESLSAIYYWVSINRLWKVKMQGDLSCTPHTSFPDSALQLEAEALLGGGQEGSHTCPV